MSSTRTNTSTSESKKYTIRHTATQGRNSHLRPISNMDEIKKIANLQQKQQADVVTVSLSQKEEKDKVAQQITKTLQKNTSLIPERSIKLKLGAQPVSCKALLFFMSNSLKNIAPFNNPTKKFDSQFDKKNTCNTLSDITESSMQTLTQFRQEEDSYDKKVLLKIYLFLQTGSYALLLNHSHRGKYYQLPTEDSPQEIYQLSFTLLYTLIDNNLAKEFTQQTLFECMQLLLMMLKILHRIKSFDDSKNVEDMMKSESLKCEGLNLLDHCLRLLKRNKKTKSFSQETERFLAAIRLEDAIVTGTQQEIDAILTRHPDVVNQNLAGSEPIISSIDSCSLAICQQLVTRGADINTFSHYVSMNVLSYACISYQAEIVAYLLDQKAETNPKNQPSTIDRFAFWIFQSNNSESHQDQTKLQEKYRREVLILNLLFTAKGQYDKRNLLNKFTQIKRQDLIDCVEAAQTLADSDPLVDIKNESQKTTPQPTKQKKTREQKQREQLSTLHSKAHTAFEKENYDETLKASQQADKIKRQILLRNHRAAFPKTRSSDEKRFEIEIKMGKLEDARVSFNKLIKAGMKKGEIVNMRLRQGETLLIEVAKKTDAQSIKTVKFLVEESRANITLCDDEGRTVLHSIAQSNNISALICLVSHCAEDLHSIVDQQDSNGETALHYAVASVSATPLLVEMLLAQGASFSIKDKSGNTPQTLATKPDILQLFNEAEMAQKEAKEAKEEADKEKKEEKERIDAIKRQSVHTPEEAFVLLKENMRAPDDEFALIQARCAGVKRKLWSTFRENPTKLINGILLQKFLKLTREYDKQREILFKLKENHAKNIPVAIDIAKNYINCGNLDKAEETLLEMQVEPGTDFHQQQLVFLFQVYEKKKNNKKMSETNRSLQTLPSTQNHYIELKKNLINLKLNIILRKKQKHQPIILLFNQALAQFKNEPQILIMQAWYYFDCDLSASKQYFEALQAIDLKTHLFGFAKLYERMGDTQNAKLYYDQLQTQFSKFYAGGLAAIKFQQKQYSADPEKDHADYVANLEQLKKDFPSHQEPYLLLAHAHWDHGDSNEDYTAAVKAYYELFDTFPEAVDAHIDYIYHEMSAGNTKTALTFCGQLLPDADEEDDCFSRSAAFYLAYIEALLEDGQEEKAKAIRALCAQKFPSDNENMIAINDRLGILAEEPYDDEVTDEYPASAGSQEAKQDVPASLSPSSPVSSVKETAVKPLTLPKPTNITSLEVKRDFSTSSSPASHSPSLISASKPFESKTLINELTIPASIQPYFTQFQSSGLIAILDGITTMKIIALSEVDHQELRILTTASPAFLTTQFKAIHIEDNNYQVNTLIGVLSFTSLPHLKTEKDLTDHALQENNFANFATTTNMQGKIQWTPEAEKAYSTATLSVLASKKEIVDGHFRNDPIRLLIIPEIAIQFNLSIDQTLKDQVDRHANILRQATQSNPPRPLHEVLHSTPAALQQMLASYTVKLQKNAYRNNAYDFYRKLYECGTTLISLIFPSAHVLSETDHQDIISQLAAMKSKQYDDPIEAFNDFCSLVATWQNRSSYGTRAFMRNLRAQRAQYELNLKEIRMTTSSLSQILHYARKLHMATGCLTMVTPVPQNANVIIDANGIPIPLPQRISFVPPAASLVGPQQLWQQLTLATNDKTKTAPVVKLPRRFT